MSRFILFLITICLILPEFLATSFNEDRERNYHLLEFSSPSPLISESFVSGAIGSTTTTYTHLPT